jgi:hypothetical protein
VTSCGHRSPPSLCSAAAGTCSTPARSASPAARAPRCASRSASCRAPPPRATCSAGACWRGRPRAPAARAAARGRGRRGAWRRRTAGWQRYRAPCPATASACGSACRWAACAGSTMAWRALLHAGGSCAQQRSVPFGCVAWGQVDYPAEEAPAGSGPGDSGRGEVAEGAAGLAEEARQALSGPKRSIRHDVEVTQHCDDSLLANRRKPGKVAFGGVSTAWLCSFGPGSVAACAGHQARGAPSSLAARGPLGGAAGEVRPATPPRTRPAVPHPSSKPHAAHLPYRIVCMNSIKAPRSAPQRVAVRGRGPRLPVPRRLAAAAAAGPGADAAGAVAGRAAAAAAGAAAGRLAARLGGPAVAEPHAVAGPRARPRARLPGAGCATAHRGAPR